jgi:glycosyltransferase involved in cell wall biosynthesis
VSISLLAVHQGGGVGGAPVSLLKLLAELNATEFSPAPTAIFTESGEILAFAAELGVPASVVPTGGALFYSAHARLGPRSVARFVRTFPAAVQTACRSLRTARPDLLHLNTSVLLAWAAAARREHVPVVWTVREVLGPNPWLRRWHASFIVRHARRVVAISDAVLACFEGQNAANVRRVYNAVDLAEFSPDMPSSALAVRAELGIGADSQIVMVVGSVQRVKGHWLLLDAFGRMSAPDTHLVLVTGGVSQAYATTWRGRLKRLAGRPMDNLDALLRDARHANLAERVLATGFRRDITRLLSAADVLAFPSLEPEGFGRPIIEAMAMARPVVATDVGPSRELLGPEAGRLVAPDAAALAAALDNLLRSPDERERMGRAGRRRVEACFSLDRQVAAMYGIYREAVGSG